MNEFQILDWFTESTPGQFFLGVALLVFGSKQILSEKSVTNSLGGLSLPFRWLSRKRDQIARDDAQEVIDLRLLVNEQHKYIVEVTRRARALEIHAADKGFELPPPPFETFEEWVKSQDGLK